MPAWGSEDEGVGVFSAGETIWTSILESALSSEVGMVLVSALRDEVGSANCMGSSFSFVSSLALGSAVSGVGEESLVTMGGKDRSWVLSL